MATALSHAASWSGRSLHLPSLQPIVTGMPELCRTGLSENWLLKACGHRHWLALAQAHGLAVPEFHDSDGARLYPAFAHLRITDARLDVVAEHCRLDFGVTLSRTSRTRFRSEIAVTCDGERIATVTLETVFIRRTVAASNRATRRAVVASPCLLTPQARAPLAAADPGDDPNGPALASVILDPSPHEDFNGVGFLYFAAFQAMADRADWLWFRDVTAVRVIRERQIAFRANAELGDRIRATLLASTRQDGQRFDRMTLSRESDGVIISTISTRGCLCQARQPMRLGNRTVAP